ncbi:MAG: hypothetical protein VW835_19715 [Rickettsiales bacterium]
MTVSNTPPLQAESIAEPNADLESARRVFRLEADGILALAESLDENFASAVQVI